jgi:hypothetical protein
MISPQRVVQIVTARPQKKVIPIIGQASSKARISLGIQRAGLPVALVGMN